MKTSFAVVLTLILGLSLTLTACGGPTSAEAQAVDFAPVAQVQAQQASQPDYSKLSAGQTVDGDSITSVVAGICSCDGPDKYEDLGILVVRNGVQTLHIENKRAFKSFIFDNTAIFTLQPGDLVYVGKVDDVRNAATQKSALRITNQVDPSGIEFEYANGGNLKSQVSARIDVDRSSWILFANGYEFTNVDQALACIESGGNNKTCLAMP